jgi:prevent-host-death family protein
MEVSIVELRRHTRRVMEAVARGETVTVTSRGKVAAVMVPPEQRKEPEIPITEDPAFGMWKDRDDMKDPSAWVRELRGRRRHALR